MEAFVHDVTGRVCGAVREQGVNVPETLAAFLALSITLENESKFGLSAVKMEREAGRYDRLVGELADALLPRLMVTDSPVMETMRMQVAVDTARVRATRKIQVKNGSREASALRILDDIVKVRLTECQRVEDEETQLLSIYDLIFQYVCWAGHMQYALDNAFSKEEVLAGLESIFPRVGLRRFLTLSIKDRKHQLEDLPMYVLGIQILNRNLSKGGGMLDKPEPLTQNVAVAAHLLEAINAEERLVQDYQIVIGQEHARMANIDEERRDLTLLNRLRAEHTNRSQYVSFLRSFYASARDGSEISRALSSQMENELEAANASIYGKESIPKSQVYPIFDKLAKLHLDLLRAAEDFDIRTAAAQALDEFANSFTSVLSERQWKTALSAASTSQQFRQDADSTLDMTSLRVGSALIVYRGRGAGVDDPEFALHSEIIPELNGHCPLALVDSGSLVFGDDRSPVVILDADAGGGRTRVYHMSTREAAQSFASNYLHYQELVRKKAVEAPELIRLLSLEEDFPSVVISNIAGYIELGVTAVTCNFGTQTPVHFLEKNLDYGYEWNEWALRRRAIALANLYSKKTHSMQTNLSHFKREIEQQIYVPKDVSTQSRSDRGTRMSRQVQYIGGLRGAPDTELNVVNLKLEI